MFKVVVVRIPLFQFLLQLGKTFEMVPAVEFLLVFPMTSFHCAILGRFARVNQIVNNAVFGAETIERVDDFHGLVAPFVGAGVVVGENTAIVSLHGLD